MEKGKTKHNIKDTLVLNLYGGPCSGKSTTSAGIFYDLKNKSITCELASEFAKDLCWEERHQTFNDQIYIFGKQFHRIYRLLGQVDVVITDSPLLLTPVYDNEQRPELEALAVSEHEKMWYYNVFIKRVKDFNKKGRNQDENEAKILDRIILDMLDKHKQLYEVFDGNDDGKNGIVKKILMRLEYKKSNL